MIPNRGEGIKAILIAVSTVLLFGASQVQAAKSAKIPVQVFRVQPGQTLYRFALRCHKSVLALRQINRLEGNTIRVGQRIACDPDYDLRQSQIRLQGIEISLLEINLARAKLTVLEPKRGLGHGGERLLELAKRSGVMAAINGGFFDPHSYVPAGQIVIEGKLRFQGRIRTALAISKNGQARVLEWGPVRRASLHPTAFETVIGNGPYIVRHGKVRVAPKLEGYRDGAILKPAARSAIGLRSEQELILVSTTQKITLEQLAQMLHALHTKEALMLDGGSSTGFYWCGKLLVRPLRRISYGIGVQTR